MSSNNETVRDGVAYNPGIDQLFEPVISLRFPCPVRQVGDNTIEIQCTPGPVMFTDLFVRRVIELLGKRDATRLLDNITNRVNRELLLAQVVEL